MKFELKAKHIKKAYEVAAKTIPIILPVAEAIFPKVKPIRTISKVTKILF